MVVYTEKAIGGESMDKKITLDYLIEASGLKYDNVAEQLGISSNYLWRLRKEPHKMTMRQIDKLADILNVEPSEVINAITRKG